MTTTDRPRTARRRRAPRGSGEQLRPEIVAAAKTLLRESANADAVSIRAVADAVGVSPPSIYLHFADKSELLSAVVGDVFADLDTAMLAAAEGVVHPLERLRVFGVTYVRFALDHPEHYRIATMDPCPLPNPEVDDVLRSSAFAHFQETVLACMQAGIFTVGDPLATTLALWSAAHGAASLVIAKPYLPWGDLDEFADRVLCAAAAGHAVRDLLGGQPSPSDVTSWLTAVSADRDGPSQ